MKNIFLIPILLLALNVCAQSPLAPVMKITFTGQTVFSDPYTMTGNTNDFTSNWDATNIAVGDSVFQENGADLQVYVVTSITPSGTNFTMEIDDVYDTGQLPNLSEAAHYGDIQNRKYQPYTAGISESLQTKVQNRFFQFFVAGGSTIDSTHVWNDSVYAFIGVDSFFTGMVNVVDVLEHTDPDFIGVVGGNKVKDYSIDSLSTNLDSQFVWSKGVKYFTGINSGTDEQVASEVPTTPSGNFASTDAQAGFQEHQADIDALQIKPDSSIFQKSGTASGSQTWALGSTTQTWNSTGVSPLIQMDGTNGGVGIGGNTVSNVRFDLTGKGNTSSTYTSRIRNSDNTKNILIRGNGTFSVSNTPYTITANHYLHADYENNQYLLGPGNSFTNTYKFALGYNNGANSATGQAYITGVDNSVNASVMGVTIGYRNNIPATTTSGYVFGSDLNMNGVDNAILIGFGVDNTVPSTSVKPGIEFAYNCPSTVGVYGPQQSSNNTWTASNDTVTIAAGHSFTVQNGTIGFLSGSTIEWRRIVSLPSSTTVKVSSNLIAASGTGYRWQLSTAATFEVRNQIQEGLLSVLPNGQQRNHKYGAGTFTGTIATLGAWASDGKVIEPTPTQIKTYLSLGGGTDRTITTDQSYTSTDLRARVKISDTTDNTDFITYTLPASPAEGDLIYIRNISTVNDANDGAQINGNGKNIMGSATYEFVATGTIILRYSADGTEWEIY